MPRGKKNPPPADGTAAPAKKKATPMSPWGISLNSPFLVYGERILRHFVAPDIQKTIESFGPGGFKSLPEVTSRFNELTKAKISSATMRRWLHAMGYELKVQPVIVPIAGRASTPTEDGSAPSGKDFFNEQPPAMAGGPADL